MSVFDVCSFILILIAVIFEYYYIYTFIKSKKGKYPPFVPTKKTVLNEINNTAAPFLSLQEHKNIVEPGCGDARILKMLADAYPQHSYIGYEWDYVPYLLARLKQGNIKTSKLNARILCWRIIRQSGLSFCLQAPKSRRIYPSN